MYTSRILLNISTGFKKRRVKYNIGSGLSTGRNTLTGGKRCRFGNKNSVEKVVNM